MLGGVNMRQVTQDEFLGALKVEPRDVMPTAVSGQRSEWREKDKPWTSLWGVVESDGNSGDKFFLA